MAREIISFQTVAPIKKELSRNFRKEMTPAENKLWHHIRNRQINNRKFRRQQVIAGFIVDFYCSEIDLVIEIDGDIHAFQQEYDEEREKLLKQRDIKVVRYTNDQVLHEMESVLLDLYNITS